MNTGILSHLKIEFYKLQKDLIIGIENEDINILQLIISIVGHLVNKDPTLSEQVGDMKLVQMICGFLSFQTDAKARVHLDLH